MFETSSQTKKYKSLNAKNLYFTVKNRFQSYDSPHFNPGPLIIMKFRKKSFFCL